jgi:hypothetical protein
MPRLKNARTHVTVNVDEATAASLRVSHEWRDPEELAAEEAAGGAPVEPAYGESSIKSLKKLIADRNQGREPETRISDKGDKAALVAALEADDEAAADDDEDDDPEDAPAPSGDPATSPFSN